MRGKFTFEVELRSLFISQIPLFWAIFVIQFLRVFTIEHVMPDNDGDLRGRMIEN